MRVLNRDAEQELGAMIVEAVESELGYSPEEAIPACVRAIYSFADMLGRDREQALDEAATLLADGPDQEN